MQMRDPGLIDKNIPKTLHHNLYAPQNIINIIK